MPVLIYESGSLSYTPEGFDLIEVTEHAPGPMIEGNVIFAVEGTVVSKPDHYKLVEVKKFAAYPLVVQQPVGTPMLWCPEAVA